MASPTPMKLGRYEIIERLGRGAMGVVYLARDPVIGRRVALKTLQADSGLDDTEAAEFRHRFIREAQSAGILSHPNIVTIHDVVEESEEGVAFIAMEYIEGTDLKEILRRGETLSLDVVADVATQIADALDYAHDRNVIHRDIKPANVIITAHGEVKITDFGIARLDTSDLTQEGQLLGTPNYMAPERILAEEVDHRSDIFSFGVLLYELITGHKPFEGDGVTMVTHHIVHAPFTPPPEHVPELPEGVTEVLARALAKDPDARYQLAGELAADFRLEVAGFDVPEVDTESLEGLAPPPVPPPPRSPAAGEAPTANAEREIETQDVSVELERERRGSGRVRALVGDVAERLKTLPRRWQVAAAVGAIALLLVVSGGIAWLTGEEPAPADEPVETVAEDPVAPVVASARRALEDGEPEVALDELERARRLGATDASLRELTDDARRMQRRQQQIRDETLRMAELVRAARTDLDEEEYESAIAAAEEALEIDPDSAEASEIVETARERQRLIAEREAAAEERRRREAAERQRRRAAERASAARTAEEESEAAAAPTSETSREVADRSAESPAEEPATFTLDIGFFTEISEGVLTVYADGRQIVRERFSFFERTGFFRREPRAGTIEARRRLPKGDVSLKVYVSVDGVPTRVETIDTAIAGGTTRTLDIGMNADGDLSVELE